MAVFLSDKEEKFESDADFWPDDILENDYNPILQGVASATGSLDISKKEKHPVAIFRLKKRGNIKGLAKHLAHKYGPADKGFFTRCMAAEEVQGYDEETRKAVCARAHKEQIGVWPVESPDVKAKRAAKKECAGCRKHISKIRRIR